MMLWSLSLLLLFALGAASVAFLTLMERKVLGLSQVRVGPNKPSYVGVLQPIFDGLKLLTKTLLKSETSTKFIFGPLGSFFLFCLLWILLFWEGTFFSGKGALLLFIICLSLIAYSTIFIGWISPSSFSKMGLMRSLLQSLSYEAAFVGLCLSGAILFSSASLKTEIGLLNWLFIMFWILISLMDCNRAPFDLMEGESELVSGFNTDMSSLGFVFIFLAEYGMILILSIILMEWINLVSLINVAVVVVLVMCRSVYPRMRYDIAATFMWTKLLPLTLIFFFSSFLFK